jgi:hypothetical protein
VRIWSLHPKYLDARGLVALWREGLLAQAVLKGKTSGYVRHPQLLRFKEQSLSVGFIAEYLRVVHGEAVSRGYRFAAAKISRSRAHGHLRVTQGQLEFEWRHLMEKLRSRDPELHARLAILKTPRPPPVSGSAWEHRAVGKGCRAAGGAPLNGDVSQQEPRVASQQDGRLGAG